MGWGEETPGHSASRGGVCVGGGVRAGCGAVPPTVCPPQCPPIPLTFLQRGQLLADPRLPQDLAALGGGPGAEAVGGGGGHPLRPQHGLEGAKGRALVQRPPQPLPALLGVPCQPALPQQQPTCGTRAGTPALGHPLIVPPLAPLTPPGTPWVCGRVWGEVSALGTGLWGSQGVGGKRGERGDKGRGWDPRGCGDRAGAQGQGCWGGDRDGPRGHGGVPGCGGHKEGPQGHSGAGGGFGAGDSYV